MPQVNIELQDYAKAKDGSLLIKKDGKWVITTFEELNKVNDPIIKKVEELDSDFKALARNSKHYVKYAKSHFFLVLGYLKTKVLMGEIDNIPERVWALEQMVIEDVISVEDALKESDELKYYFDKIFDDNDLVEFPQV